MTAKPNLFLKIFFGLSLGSASVVVLLMLWFAFLPDRWVYKEQFDVSESIIKEAETFRGVYGRIPNDGELTELMKKHGWQPSEQCPCYEVTSTMNYKVWFGYKAVGNSMIYRSESRTWGEEG